MLKELLEVGFLTGSRAFRTHRNDSDYDIVFSIEDSDKIDAILSETERVQSDYFSGFVVMEGNKKINLIPVHPHDYLPWYLATQAMKTTLFKSGILDPIKKYSVFQAMVALFKGTVEQRRTLQSYSEIKDKIKEWESS